MQNPVGGKGGGSRMVPLHLNSLESPERSGLSRICCSLTMFYCFQSVSPFYTGILMFLLTFLFLIPGTTQCEEPFMHLMITPRGGGGGDCLRERGRQEDSTHGVFPCLHTSARLHPYFPDSWLAIFVLLLLTIHRTPVLLQNRTHDPSGGCQITTFTTHHGFVPN